MCKPISSKYGFARISAEFLCLFPFFFSFLTIQEQQIFFLPCLAIDPNKIYSWVGDIVKIKLADAKDFLGTSQDGANLRKAIKRANEKYFQIFVTLYGQEVAALPYTLLSIEGDVITYRIRNISILCNTGVKRKHIMLDLNFVADMGTGYRKLRGLLPIMLYIATHCDHVDGKTASKLLRCDIGDKMLHDLSGIDKYKYLFIKGYPKGFFKDIDSFLCYGGTTETKKALYEKYHNRYDEIPGAPERYVEFLKIHPDGDWELEFDLVIAAVARTIKPHFNRKSFEKRVLEPILEAINALGGCIKIIEVNKYKRAGAGEKAIKEKSLYLKNYNHTDCYISELEVSGDGLDPKNYKIGIVYDNGKNYFNFSSLVKGGQYSVFFINA